MVRPNDVGDLGTLLNDPFKIVSQVRPQLTGIYSGPSIGGYLGLAAGWRWVMGFLALFAGILCILGFSFVPETYAPVLLRKRAMLMSKVTGKVYMTAMDVDHPQTYRDLLQRSMVRPWALLYREPIVLLLSVSHEHAKSWYRLLTSSVSCTWQSYMPF